MCLAADVPLIESGTTGFNGQVQVIKLGRTACYECSAKPTPKSFPICTIRSTPSQPIHCIVWAKSYLLAELFGESEAESTDLDSTEDADNAEEVENLRHEAQALMKIRDAMGSDDFIKQVFDKVFTEDIERLRKMEDMWKTRPAPEPLSYSALESQRAASAIDPDVASMDQRAWTLPEVFSVFKSSLQRLSTRLLSLKSALTADTTHSQPSIPFDKDDPDTLDFVSSASNLRSAIFSIPLKSKFEVKQMAGNIIPAIATTNAMVASLCVLQAFKVLKGDLARTKMAFLNRGVLSAGRFDDPNPECSACSVAMSRVAFDPRRATLNDLVDDVLKQQLGYSEEISIMNEKGIVFDPDMEDNLGKTLKDLGIGDASFLIVKDESEENDKENPRVDLQLAVSAKSLGEDEKPVVLTTEISEIPRKPRRTVAEMLPGHVNGVTAGAKANEESEAINGMTAPDSMSSAIAIKRKRAADEADLEEITPKKKMQQLQVSDPASIPLPAPTTDESIVLDGIEEGAIEIDDD